MMQLKLPYLFQLELSKRISMPTAKTRLQKHPLRVILPQRVKVPTERPSSILELSAERKRKVEKAADLADKVQLIHHCQSWHQLRRSPDHQRLKRNRPATITTILKQT
jgi:hypothetical protein